MLDRCAVQRVGFEVRYLSTEYIIYNSSRKPEHLDNIQIFYEKGEQALCVLRDGLDSIHLFYSC